MASDFGAAGPRLSEGIRCWRAIESEAIRAGQRRLVVGTPCNCPGRAGAKLFPRRGDFEVQQVQQNHKRPCLQEVSEFLKVQQKCNMKCNSGSGKVRYSVEISKLAHACGERPQ